MSGRIELHGELLEFCPNVYFQPPAKYEMKYPCIVYNKSGKQRTYGNDDIYKNVQQYAVTVISPDPDNPIADYLEDHFQYAAITNYMVVDNTNNVYLTIYY